MPQAIPVVVSMVVGMVASKVVTNITGNKYLGMIVGAAAGFYASGAMAAAAGETAAGSAIAGGGTADAALAATGQAGVETLATEAVIGNGMANIGQGLSSITPQISTVAPSFSSTVSGGFNLAGAGAPVSQVGSGLLNSASQVIAPAATSTMSQLGNTAFGNTMNSMAGSTEGLSWGGALDKFSKGAGFDSIGGIAKTVAPSMLQAYGLSDAQQEITDREDAKWKRNQFTSTYNRA